MGSCAGREVPFARKWPEMEFNPIEILLNVLSRDRRGRAAASTPFAIDMKERQTLRCELHRHTFNGSACELVRKRMLSRECDVREGFWSDLVTLCQLEAFEGLVRGGCATGSPNPMTESLLRSKWYVTDADLIMLTKVECIRLF